MKKIFTLLLVVLLGSVEMQAQENEIQPLVREGVVWHYAYLKMNVEAVPEYGSSMFDHKVQFKGDTLVNDIAYKKCYFYKTENLEENEKPVMLAREADGAVMFAGTEEYEWYDYSSWLETTLPGEYYQLTGERIVYDFGNMPEFIANIKKQNQADEYFQMELLATEQVSVAGKTVNRYTLTGDYMFPESYYVESVGVDGDMSGYLFEPLVPIPTCFCSGPRGLIKLTDLDGNLLYKGIQYDEYYSAVDKILSSKQPLRVEQRESGMLHIALPADGMLSVIDMAGHVVISRVVTQGTTEVSTASLAAGVYLVQLSTPAGIQTAKVVVK